MIYFKSNGNVVNKKIIDTNKLLIGLGWNALELREKCLFFRTKKVGIDCDAAAILVRDKRFINQEDVVYYNLLCHKTGCVRLIGDNRTGEGEGDDEQIVIDLSLVPEDVNKIVIAVNIYEAARRKHHFGMISDVFIRLFDCEKESEICRYSLTEAYNGMTTMIFGEICRCAQGWQFELSGHATKDADFLDVLKRYM